jgi:preprotein translocase subunit SecB
VKKHFAEIARLADITLRTSTFDLSNIDVQDGSSLEITISIDHDFCESKELPLFQCNYKTSIEGVNPDKEKIFLLEASFMAIYQLTEVQDWDENEITTFIDKCVNFHVWPYMREHAHYLSAKANIPTVILPLLPSAHERNNKD